MGSRFFSDEQIERLRSFPDIGREELARFFTLTRKDLGFVDNLRRSGGRGPEARLGLAAADICPTTRRGRLSYPRAEYLFKQATAALDPHGIGWTLHQLRHSALQHLAAAGRTAPELQAKSRHQHLASLGRYVQLGEQTSARLTADADPASRRRSR
jgi:integrase